MQHEEICSIKIDKNFSCKLEITVNMRFGLWNENKNALLRKFSMGNLFFPYREFLNPTTRFGSSRKKKKPSEFSCKDVCIEKKKLACLISAGHEKNLEKK